MSRSLARHALGQATLALSNDADLDIVLELALIERRLRDRERAESRGLVTWALAYCKHVALGHKRAAQIAAAETRDAS